MRRATVCPSRLTVEPAIMSASFMSLHRCCQRSALLLVARRRWSSSSVSPPPLRTRLLLFLTQRFYDVEMLFSWGSQLRSSSIEKKNVYYGYTQRFYGPNIAAAYYILSLKGGFRYVGQSEWFRADQRGKFNWDFLDHKETPLEEVNMSYTLMNYSGLGNLEGQQSLRTLSLRGCPEVDDWFLARLHMLQDSLEELDISHCPRITTGGLAALRNLKGLRRLDVSSLPGISSPGLVIILLEEMLPQCQITATGYDHSLRQEGGGGDRGAHARAEIGMEQGWESRDSVQKEKEASGRALLSALYFDRRAKRHAEETPHIRRVSDQTSLVITEKVHHGNMGIFQRTSSKVLTNSTSTNQS